MKKITAAVSGAFIGWAALCGGVSAAGNEEPRWFGLSESDFGRVGEFLGSPLKVKARFVRLMGPGAGPQRRTGRAAGTRTFLVETAAGEIICEIAALSRGGLLTRHMKSATPLVLHGTLDPDTYVLRVEKLLQGWERKNVEGTEKR